MRGNSSLSSSCPVVRGIPFLPPPHGHGEGNLLLIPSRFHRLRESSSLLLMSKEKGIISSFPLKSTDEGKLLLIPPI